MNARQIIEAEAEDPKRVFKLLPRYANQVHAYDENDQTAWMLTDAEVAHLLAKDMVARSTCCKGLYYATWWVENDMIHDELRKLRHPKQEAEDPKACLRAIGAARERRHHELWGDDFKRGPGYYLEVMAGRGNPAHDLAEGPWDTVEDAQEFFDAEVGVPCRIVYVGGAGERHTLTTWMMPR